MESHHEALRKVRREPLSPQIFWIAGIALLIFAGVLIFGELIVFNSDLRRAEPGVETAGPRLSRIDGCRRLGDGNLRGDRLERAESPLDLA